MKIARFLHKGKERFGIVEGDHIQAAEGEIFGQFHRTRQGYPLEKVKLLPPVMPSKIVAIGLNYKDHAAEVKFELPEEPLIFLKPGSAVIGHLDPIIYPPMSRRVDFEGELGIVIGKTAHNVSEARADEFILGYTCFNDVTARDLQGKDGQWTRSKGFDTFAPPGALDRDGDRHRMPQTGDLPQRGAQAGIRHLPSHLSAEAPRQLHIPDHDPLSRGLHCHRHPLRHWTYEHRRYGGGSHRGDREFGKCRYGPSAVVAEGGLLASGIAVFFIFSLDKGYQVMV